MLLHYNFPFGPVPESLFEGLLNQRRQMLNMGLDDSPTMLERGPQIFIADNVERATWRGRQGFYTKRYIENVRSGFNGASNIKIGSFDEVGVTKSFTFYDEYHGAPRFNIVAHGSPGGGRIWFDGIPYDAQKPIEIATAAKQERDFSSIRLLTCYGGEGGEESLAFKISQHMHTPVKAYKGKVLGSALRANPKDIQEKGAVKAATALERTAEGMTLGRVKIVKEIENGQFMANDEGSVLVGAEFFDL